MFSPGGLVPGLSVEEIPLDVSAVDLEDLTGHLHELEVDEALIAELEAQAGNILKGLPDLLKRMQEREKLAQKRREGRLGDPAPGAAQDARLLRLRAARDGGRDTARGAQDPGRQDPPLEGGPHRPYKRPPHPPPQRALRRRTLRPVPRLRREGKPRLALLCDVSLSTRNLSRFWLHMIYQMQSLFSKVRTFVFVADAAEVAQVFEERDMNRAVDEIFSGHIIDADVNSDFGKAAEQFKDRYLPTINHRTTLVVLGDGRNNGRWANVAAFGEIAQHARQVIWITPEPKWGWSLGSCDMPLYEPLCDAGEVVHGADHLAGVAEEVVKTRS